jgi:hypothetical protein
MDRQDEQDVGVLLYAEWTPGATGVRHPTIDLKSMRTVTEISPAAMLISVCRRNNRTL